MTKSITKATLLGTCALSLLALTNCSEDRPMAPPVQTVTTTSGATKTTDTVVNPDGTTTTTTSSSHYGPATAGMGFNDYAFSRWDLNHDGIVSPDEWQTSTVDWYGPTTTTTTSGAPVYQTYTYWDKNGNGQIDANEFNTAAGSTKLYNTWETNGRALSKTPNEGQFVVYDVNGDGKITPSEWANMH